MGCRAEPTPPPDTEATSPGRAYLVRTEGLDLPVLGSDQVFRPRFRGDLDPGEGAGRVAGFSARVVASNPDDVRMRIVHEGTGEASELEQVAVTNPGRLHASIEPDDLDSTVRARLAAGVGVFWAVPADDDEPGGGTQFAVLLPVDRLALARLDVYVDVGPSSGAPLFPASLKLTPDFFYMAAIGDSSVWGNGLLEEDKFTTRVARTVAAETGRHVVRQVRAVSGARIVPSSDDGTCTDNCDGEVPKAFTSITVQAQEMESPEILDLVLLDGCINDVGVFDTLLSIDVDSNGLEALTRDVCGTEMTGLLRLVRQRAPNAVIVLAGYYRFVSAETDISQLEALALAAGISPENLDALRQGVASLVRNSEIFDAVARESLSRAVQTVAGETAAQPPIVFADPGFGSRNAVFAPDAWLWGLVSDPEWEDALDLPLPLLPEDPLLEYRAEACQEPDARPDLLPCLYASVGHNNPAGARRYAEAITQALRDVGVLPAEEAD
jgi:hypothetical protein